MSQTAENKSIWQDGFENWHRCKGEDTSCWTSIMSPDIRLQSLAEGTQGLDFAVTRHGIGDIDDYFSGLVRTFKMNHFTIDDCIAEGDKVVSVGSCAWTSRETGKTIETPHVAVTRFENGRMVQFFEYYDTAAVAKTL